MILDKDFNINKIFVYDVDGVEKMSFIIDKINFKPKFDNDFFELEFNVENEGDNVSVDKTSCLDDVIYPLYVPDGTKLVDEKKFDDNGLKRVIMNYDGEKSFLLVEEVSNVFNDFTVIPSDGEPLQLLDTFGIVTSNSLSWSSEGVDYYLISDVMDKDELVEVAQSIVGIVVTK